MMFKFLKNLLILAGIGPLLLLSAPASAQNGVNMESWHALLGYARSRPLGERIRHINDYFNAVTPISDQEQWGVVDYWASPRETVSNAAGDCEDIAIAKYYSLRASGVPDEHVWLAYGKVLDRTSSQVEAHVVVFVLNPQGGEPWVLDNMEPRIMPASKRSDAHFSLVFKEAGIWPYDSANHEIGDQPLKDAALFVTNASGRGTVSRIRNLSSILGEDVAALPGALQRNR